MSAAELFTLDIVDHRLWPALAIVVVAGAMRGFAGFGSAMAMSPILAWLYGPTEMIVLITVMELIVSFQLVPGALKDGEWRFVGPLTLAAVVTMPLGVWLLQRIDADLLTRIVAGVVVVFTLYLMTGFRYRGPKRLSITLGLGGVSGVLIATTSMGGPPVLAYILSGPDRAAVNRANIILYYALTEIALILAIWQQDLITPEALSRGLLFTPFYLLTAALGARLFQASSEQLYRRLALVFLLAVGTLALLR